MLSIYSYGSWIIKWCDLGEFPLINLTLNKYELYQGIQLTFGYINNYFKVIAAIFRLLNKNINCIYGLIQ